MQVAPTARRRGGHPVRSDIVPGGTFPDYALPDHAGTVRTLSELQGRDRLILTLARGNYCPKEHELPGIEQPIVLAPMAAVPPLAAAVSNASSQRGRMNP
jgi:hypothetical protein